MTRDYAALSPFRPALWPIRQCRTDMRGGYDFIVGGAGTTGSVVARRLAENVEITDERVEMNPPDWLGRAVTPQMHERRQE